MKIQWASKMLICNRRTTTKLHFRWWMKPWNHVFVCAHNQLHVYANFNCKTDYRLIFNLFFSNINLWVILIKVLQVVQIKGPLYLLFHWKFLFEGEYHSFLQSFLWDSTSCNFSQFLNKHLLTQHIQIGNLPWGLFQDVVHLQFFHHLVEVVIL